MNILLLISTHSVADESVVSTNEILFRNVRWGSNFSEVIEQIPDYPLVLQDGFTGFLNEDGPWISNLIELGSVSSNALANEISGTVSINAYKPLKVAGYKVDHTHLYFARIPVNGVLTTNDDNTTFYAAQYYFGDSNDITTLTEDLKIKISSIYGEPGETRKCVKLATAKMCYSGDIVCWYGLNDTLITLISVTRTFEGVYVT